MIFILLSISIYHSIKFLDYNRHDSLFHWSRDSILFWRLIACFQFYFFVELILINIYFRLFTLLSFIWIKHILREGWFWLLIIVFLHYCDNPILLHLFFINLLLFCFFGSFIFIVFFFISLYLSYFSQSIIGWYVFLAKLTLLEDNKTAGSIIATYP